MRLDRSKTLEELEEEVWKEPHGEYVSPLVARCHALRTKSIGEFTPGDLRIMIGQEIGLLFLVPLAIQVLKSAPLVEGDYFPGDLLKSVLRLDQAFWREEPDLYAHIQAIINNLRVVPSEIAEEATHFRHLIL